MATVSAWKNLLSDDHEVQAVLEKLAQWQHDRMQNMQLMPARQLGSKVLPVLQKAFPAVTELRMIELSRIAPRSGRQTEESYGKSLVGEIDQWFGNELDRKLKRENSQLYERLDAQSLHSTGIDPLDAHEDVWGSALADELVIMYPCLGEGTVGNLGLAEKVSETYGAAMEQLLYAAARKIPPTDAEFLLSILRQCVPIGMCGNACVVLVH